MNQVEKAKRFAKLHVKGSPLVLYNAWDAGSAKVIHEAGAKAVATSSWSVAAAHAYEDGEDIPLELVETIVARIVATVDVPVTADFEGGYSDSDTVLANSISQLLHLGVIGINACVDDELGHHPLVVAVDRGIALGHLTIWPVLAEVAVRNLEFGLRRTVLVARRAEEHRVDI